MGITIRIRMDNAAFEPANGIEAARILRNLAEKLANAGELAANDEVKLRDINGNSVGSCKVWP